MMCCEHPIVIDRKWRAVPKSSLKTFFSRAPSVTLQRMGTIMYRALTGKRGANVILNVYDFMEDNDFAQLSQTDSYAWAIYDQLTDVREFDYQVAIERSMAASSSSSSSSSHKW